MSGRKQKIIVKVEVCIIRAIVSLMFQFINFINCHRIEEFPNVSAKIQLYEIFIKLFEEKGIFVSPR